MFQEILYKLSKNPLGLIRRAIDKVILAPFKYGKGKDYNAQKYWHDRFSKYGNTLTASGDEGLSEEENRYAYKQAANIITSTFFQENIEFEKIDALEIGCGTGFYTQLLYDQKVKNYVGIDITDVLFLQLKQKFPDYHFINQDITAEDFLLTQLFDLIIIIDVIEHIVSETKLARTLTNIQKYLKPDGVVLISPIMNTNKKPLFYLHFWTIEDIKQHFPEQHYSFRELVPFRQSFLLIIKKKV